MRGSFEIREAFLKFFEQKGHYISPSSNLITGDKSLLFVNAGMVPFKKYFLNEETPKYETMTSSQKCLRVSGKHNDLDQVGFTKRHHTFFEMLGNFSFGKYFKTEVIPYAWEFLTKILCLDPKRLYITVFSEDQEAFDLWKKLTGFSDSKIIKIATSDNFWSMGDTGPCGPCSEIFYDHGEKYPGDIPGSGNEQDRFIEIWNLVFMQKNKQDADTMVDLEKKCIDTGMGLERIAAVLNGNPDNYETDLFSGILNAAFEILGGKNPKDPAYRVIADHVRSSCFLLSEGLLPSNEGRGYVLRRIIRRAVNYLYKINKDKFLYEICDFFLKDFGRAYPELLTNKEFILSAVENEENLFKESYFKGFKILDAELQKNKKISGDFAFKLYDTYGFPLDVTCNIVKSVDGTVDMDGFEKLMDAQRQQSRQGLDMLQKGVDFASLLQSAKKRSLNITETEFLGYENYAVKDHSSKVLSISKNNEIVDTISGGEQGVLILDKTVFYAESGGQMADIGVIKTNSAEIRVLDVKKQDGVFLHFIEVLDGTLKIGDAIDMKIALDNRKATAANHTATHILHKVLRETLGNFVTQHGSMVSAEKLRFDFNYQKPLGKDLLRQIERRVNDVIFSNFAVKTDVKSQKDAVAEGAMALFGEKYGDFVRVVKINDEGEDFCSKELCGGTHVKNTSEIGVFKILSEASIAAGIRRIEAITARAAYEYMNSLEQEIDDVKTALGGNVADMKAKVESILAENSALQMQKNQLLVNDCMAHACCFEKDGHQVVFGFVQNFEANNFRAVSDRFVQKFSENAEVILANQNGEKISFSVTISKDLCENLDAKAELLKIIAHFGCKGCGGRNNFAQGGVNISNMDAVTRDALCCTSQTKEKISENLLKIIESAI